MRLYHLLFVFFISLQFSYGQEALKLKLETFPNSVYTEEVSADNSQYITYTGPEDILDRFYKETGSAESSNGIKATVKAITTTDALNDQDSIPFHTALSISSAATGFTFQPFQEVEGNTSPDSHIGASYSSKLEVMKELGANDKLLEGLRALERNELRVGEKVSVDMSMDMGKDGFGFKIDYVATYELLEFHEEKAYLNVTVEMKNPKVSWSGKDMPCRGYGEGTGILEYDMNQHTMSFAKMDILFDLYVDMGGQIEMKVSTQSAIVNTTTLERDKAN